MGLLGVWVVVFLVNAFGALRSYEEFPAAMIPVFLGGLFGGAVVLTWVNNHTGGSILAVAVWHALHA